ncbi:MAG: hypothetical protein IH608_12580 [Proteobacteria bacterium]|nr:hypothetical protein [Pseudomonadota bacterium]
MKQITRTLLVAAVGTVLSLPALAGSMDQGSMQGMDHGSMKGMEMKAGGQAMEHEARMGQKIHESTVEGYELVYHTMDNAAAMEKMKDMKGMQGHDMSQMKSHHLMLYIVGPDGKPVDDAKVGYKVEGPAGEQKTMAMGMEGGFGADVELKAKGTYEIKAKAMIGDKSLVDEFKYEVK